MIGFLISSLLLVAFSFGLNYTELSLLLMDLLRVGFWFSLSATLHFLMKLVIWRGLVPHFTGTKVPRVLIQINAVALILIALCIILVRIFSVPVGNVITTSSIFIAIIGFALRNMISDLFTGIALGIEQPFSLGDWLQIQDGTVGQVVEMNWRSTRLLTREEISVVIPNSELAISTFKNYSKPERPWRDEFEILLDQYVTAHQAERLLLSAIRLVPEITALNKTAEVRISEYTPNGIVWQLRYWVPDYPRMSELRYKVQRSILRSMHYAGLSIPSAQVRVNPHPDSNQDEAFQFLRRIGLFRELVDEELEQLKATMKERLVKASEEVVIQGDQGDSLFVVKEGLMRVNISRNDRSPVTVANLLPGSFFGEMSLLTGDTRNATVTAQVDSLVFEVKKSDFEPVLSARPEIAKLLSETIAERQYINNHYDGVVPVKSDNDEESLIRRIRGFFALDDRVAIAPGLRADRPT